MGKIKRIDIKEFRAKGYLQEVNRRFFHPLGLALEVVKHDDGTESLGGVWDYREDPEGIHFGPHMIEKKHIGYVDSRFEIKKAHRIHNLGYWIQVE